MKIIIPLLTIFLFFLSCSKEPKLRIESLPNTQLQKTAFDKLPEFYKENFDSVLEIFQKNCQTRQAQVLYGDLCKKALKVKDAKSFLVENFQPYKIIDDKNGGLLTGYYEAQVNASYKKSKKYRYPIYTTPKDMYIIDLSTIYPELKNYRLRGRIVKNKIVPYYSRSEANNRELNASILCYCDSKIDKFFLEVQGSGIVKLDNNSSIYIGYSNQNGHKYRSIGKYLINKNELQKEEVSLQSITKWLKEHPNRVDEVLNYNDSMIFFSQRQHSATGALGVELTPMRSIAVDKRYISLGSMLYFSANSKNRDLHSIVFAQDTGGAIKGSVRADLFVGNGDRARELAGELKAPLQLWLLLPKKKADD